MSEIASAKINSFGESPKTDFVSPSEEAVFILTSGQLQDLITQAVEKANQPALERIESMEATITQQAKDMAGLEATVNTLGDNQFIQLRLINSLREDVHTDLDKPAPEATKQHTGKTQDHITEIARFLAAKEKRLIEGEAPHSYVNKLRKEGMTFSELANVMGLTVDRIRQLSRIAATDQRFNITWHPRKRNTKIIKLRRWDVLVL